jgi:hypothetical protein
MVTTSVVNPSAMTVEVPSSSAIYTRTTVGDEGQVSQ